MNALKDAISAIGEDSLHIAANEIGTHSIWMKSEVIEGYGKFYEREKGEPLPEKKVKN